MQIYVFLMVVLQCVSIAVVKRISPGKQKHKSIKPETIILRMNQYGQTMSEAIALALQRTYLVYLKANVYFFSFRNHIINMWCDHFVISEKDIILATNIIFCNVKNPDIWNVHNKQIFMFTKAYVIIILTRTLKSDEGPCEQLLNMGQSALFT